MSHLNDDMHLFYSGAANAISRGGAQTVRDELSKAIAEGKAYTGFEVNEDVAAGGSADIIVSVGSDIAAIMVATVVSTGDQVSFYMYRDPTYTGGSELSKLNMNDNIGVTGTENVDLVTGATVTDPGDIIFGPWILYGPTGPTVEFVQVDVKGPLVLKPDTAYLIRVTNSSTAAADISTAVRYIDRG